MSQPPPPPPPHGEVPKSSGLPPGKYDIFVIPPHSAGSGFLYLPSLQPNVNSFAAGFACALILVAMFQSMAPAFQAWWNSFHGLGNMGIVMLIFGVGFGAWALGRTQTDGPSGGRGNFGGENSYGGGFGTTGSTSPPPNGGPTPQSAPPPSGQEKSNQSWQRPPPQGGTARTETPKGAWERAREETRKREEERRAKEEAEKRKEEAARRLKELREKEAREREQREKEAKERQEKLEREQREKELRDRTEKEKAERERFERGGKERGESRTARKGSSYAFSGVGERTNPWPSGKSPVHSNPPSPTKSSPAAANRRPPAPTAKTFVGTEEDAYSYRPYDQPKPPRRKKSNSSFVSENSWAPSQSTSKTTPPPSVRGPYTTKDPDKIVIKAVYLFMNLFAKTPASQLVSGVGSVTDGLILRITTEGLFIDDDVRGVPQREWDVKAWTLKLVEVWCPPHCLNLKKTTPPSASPGANIHPSLLHKMASQRARNAAASKPLTGDDADAYLTELLRSCKDCCRLGLCASSIKDTDMPFLTGQNGEWKAKGLHLLRATIRDQEGKRYMFVLGEEESWKVAVGLQRLRRGTQVRALGVSGMSGAEARAQLETLGWG